jgi:hypothetical protein
MGKMDQMEWTNDWICMMDFFFLSKSLQWFQGNFVHDYIVVGWQNWFTKQMTVQNVKKAFQRAFLIL